MLHTAALRKRCVEACIFPSELLVHLSLKAQRSCYDVRLDVTHKSLDELLFV